MRSTGKITQYVISVIILNITEMNSYINSINIIFFDYIKEVLNS